MAKMSFSGGDALQQKLRDMAAKFEKASSVKVGFMEEATYPDGTPVAQVAMTQNFGSPANGVPARPFMSNMVKAQSPHWPGQIARLMLATGYDARAAFTEMGELVKDDLVESIKQTNEPALSPITLMIRQMLHQDKQLIVSRRVVGEAARRVAAGVSYAGVSTKPLNFTGHMQNSVESKVE